MSVPPFLRLPLGVRRTDITTSRGTFATLEALPGADVPQRRPALLVPGFTGSKEDFIAILPMLSEAGHRVIAIDQRGQYETPGSDDPAAYSCAQLGADVLAILETVTSDSVHVLGHSFGGLVVREAVIAAPSRFASVTFMDSGPAEPGVSSAARARALIEALTQYKLAEIWDGFLGPEAAASGLAPEVVTFLRTRMVANSPIALTGMGLALLSALDQVDRVAAVLANAGLPAFVLYGEDEDVWEPGLLATMTKHLEARKVVIPGVGHSPAAEAPEPTATALLAFWREAEQAGTDS
jgi:pimeloyl-ACP methyl ester carboxylesterase